MDVFINTLTISSVVQPAMRRVDFFGGINRGYVAPFGPSFTLG